MTQELPITPSQLRRRRVTVFAALPPHLDRRTPIQQADEAAARLVRRLRAVDFSVE